MATIVYYEGTDNVGAWYADGQLMAEGEQDVILGQVFAEFGIEHRVSNDFLRGTSGSGTTAAATLADVETWSDEQARREADRRAARSRLQVLRSIASDAQAEISQLEARLR
jgi:hypothetical protein